MAETPMFQLQRFLASQRPSKQLDTARSAFESVKPKLAPTLRGLVDQFTAACLVTPHDCPGITILGLDDGNAGPVLLAFADRPHGSPVLLRMGLGGTGPGEREVGARVLFVCDQPDGLVHGYRVPFHAPGERPAVAKFGEWGPADKVRAEDLIQDIAGAVIDFLQWASAGDGQGSRAMPFKGD